MKDEENLSDNGKTRTGRKAVERRTELGMIRVDSEYPYPCVPPPGIREEKDGRLVIITASHMFRIRSGFCGNSAMGSKDQKEKLYSVYELREMQLVSKKILYNYL